MPNLNVEKILIGFLEANKSPDWQVHGDMPKDRPDKFILVDRTGGPRDNVVQDRAELLIEVYHKNSRVEASDEAYRIADIIPYLVHIDDVMRAEATSVVKLDDIVGKYWRYQVYCDVFYRRGGATGTIEYPVIPTGEWLQKVEDDPNPTLGGVLKVNNHAISFNEELVIKTDPDNFGGNVLILSNEAEDSAPKYIVAPGQLGIHSFAGEDGMGDWNPELSFIGPNTLILSVNQNFSLRIEQDDNAAIKLKASASSANEARLHTDNLNNHRDFQFPNASGNLALESSASGSFTTADGKTVTVVNGIITDIS